MFTLQEEFVATKQNLKDAKNQLKEVGKKYIEAEAKALFEKYPEMEEFSWTQYTPYFNDGDQCEFSANNCDPQINGDDVRGQKWNRMTKQYEVIDSPFAAAWTAVKEFLKQFNDDDCLLMFGDHAEVKVTPEGITVEEVEHD
jgi:hypothetical protein